MFATEHSTISNSPPRRAVYLLHFEKSLPQLGEHIGRGQPMKGETLWTS